MMQQHIQWKKKGADIDDVFYFMKYALGLTDLTKDSATLVFKICNKDIWTLFEIERMFKPRDQAYYTGSNAKKFDKSTI